MAQEDVTITLTADEALVLFDLLHRWEDDEHVNAPQHEADQVALWKLIGAPGESCASPLTAATPTSCRTHGHA
jgi:hypothetical protein